LIGSYTDLNIDSGSDSCSYSGLKCKLRPESNPALRLRDHLSSREEVVVFYKHSRHQGVQRKYTCADITTIVIPGNHRRRTKYNKTSYN